MSAIVPVLSLVETFIDKFVGDKDLAAKLKAQAASETFQGEVALALGQMKVNEESAKHSSVFVAGGRPAIIWVGAAALAWHFILKDLLLYVAALAGVELPPLPEMDTGELFYLVGSLLGVGGMRTFEKMRGVARDRI